MLGNKKTISKQQYGVKHQVSILYLTIEWIRKGVFSNYLLKTLEKMGISTLKMCITHEVIR